MVHITASHCPHHATGHVSAEAGRPATAVGALCDREPLRRPRSCRAAALFAGIRATQREKHQCDSLSTRSTTALTINDALFISQTKQRLSLSLVPSSPSSPVVQLLCSCSCLVPPSLFLYFNCSSLFPIEQVTRGHSLLAVRGSPTSLFLPHRLIDVLIHHENLYRRQG